MQKHGGILNTDCWVKEASLKRLHSVWFYLNDILEKANYIVGKKISSCHGPGERSRGVNEARSWGWWNYSVWCRHGRYTKLCIFQNSQNSTAQIAKRCVQFFLKKSLEVDKGIWEENAKSSNCIAKAWNNLTEGGGDEGMHWTEEPSGAKTEAPRTEHTHCTPGADAVPCAGWAHNLKPLSRDGQKQVHSCECAKQSLFLFYYLLLLYYLFVLQL